MALCGFGSVAVNHVFKANAPFGTNLEGKFLYIRDGERQWLLAAFDFSYMFRRTSLTWRNAVSKATGIPVECIWVHELQLHSAPVATQLDGKPCEKLVEVCLPVVQDTIRNAEEAELAYVTPYMGDRFNMNREQYIPGLGAVTVWVGCEFDENERPYIQSPSNMLLGDWKPDLPAFDKPIYFDRPADPQGALLVFRSHSGKIIGTLTRFSAHADIVGACCWDWGRCDPSEYKYHFDWPGYVRQTVSSALGGVGICVCGPCGNLSPKKREMRGYKAGDSQARETGEGVANACLEAWRTSSQDWRALRLDACANAHVDMPFRESFPRSREQVDHAPVRAKELTEAVQKAREADAPAYQIKQLIDEQQYWTYLPKTVDAWAGLSEEELREGHMTVEIEALRLNDLVLAGLPGESLTETCQWLRAQSLGMKLIVFDQINGYCVYQTTREQYDLGGYSYWASCLSRDAVPLMREKALKLIHQVQE